MAPGTFCMHSSSPPFRPNGKVLILYVHHMPAFPIAFSHRLNYGTIQYSVVQRRTAVQTYKGTKPLALAFRAFIGHAIVVISSGGKSGYLAVGLIPRPGGQSVPKQGTERPIVPNKLIGILHGRQFPLVSECVDERVNGRHQF